MWLPGVISRMRVAVARALANAPCVLLADEPTGNLDSKSSEEILDLLHDLHEQGKTIVMVTHDQNIANHTERIIMIRDGRLFSDLKNEYPLLRQSLIKPSAAAPSSDGKVATEVEKGGVA